MCTTTALLVAGLFASPLPSDATAIEPVALTQPSQPAGDFLALEPYGGASQIWRGNPYESEPEEGQPLGWEAGATVCFRRWMGVTGSFSRNTSGDYTLHHFLAGPRVSTPFSYYATSVMPVYVRGFAHALFGRVNSRGPSGVSDSSGEVVLGGGMDLLLLRFQFDYVRTNVAGLSRNNARAFIGAVIPLCIRGCRPDGYDGFEIGR